MTKAVAYGEKLDFNQRFMLGHGTSMEATMDTPNEVTAFLFGEFDALNRHFCRVYDRETMRTTFGCRWCPAFRQGKNPVEQSDIWEKW